MSARVLLQPIDVGFDLRVLATPIDLSVVADGTEVSYLTRDGRAASVIGTRPEIARALLAAGYRVKGVVEPDSGGPPDGISCPGETTPWGPAGVGPTDDRAG